MPVYTAVEKAAIFQAFPDDLKQAIGEYEPLEAKTIEQLHDMLIEIRRKFDLAPWHKFTLFMKMYGSANREGHITAPINKWTTHNKHANKWSNKSCQWVEMSIAVQRNANERGKVHLCVCPKSETIWNADTETAVTNVLVVLQNEAGKSYSTTLSRSWLFLQAGKYLRTLGESHGPVACTYTVGTGKTAKAVSNCMYKDDSDKNHQVVPVLTPHEIAKRAKESLPVEMLRTMFDMACVKLRELGMESTIERWSKQLKSLVGETP